MDGLILANLVKDPSTLAENQHTLDLTGLDPETVLNEVGLSVLHRVDDLYTAPELKKYTLISTSETKFHHPIAATDISVLAYIEATGMFSNSTITVTSPVILLIRGSADKEGLAITRSKTRYVLRGGDMTMSGLIDEFPFLEPMLRRPK